MGSFFEFNWILKLSEIQGLSKTPQPGRDYNFSKVGYRVYPLDVPLDLVDESWVAIARIIVTSITLTKSTTSGQYRVLRIYEDPEKSIRTEGWREVLKSVTGREPESYVDIQIT